MTSKERAITSLVSHSADVKKAMKVGNWITRNLVQHTEELKVYEVQFSMRRSHGSRILELVYDQSGDSKNGSLLWVEITDHAGTQSSENVYLPLFEAGDGKNAGDGICSSG